MVSVKTLKSSPGMALQRLLLQTKAGALKGLIGEDIIETLEGFDKSLLEGAKLGKLASRLIDPAEALRDPVKSAKIVRLLPLPKARELADKLGVEDGKDLFDRLSEAAKNTKSLQTLYSFFGVVQDERAPSEVKLDAGKANAGYGLFDHQRVAGILRQMPLITEIDQLAQHGITDVQARDYLTENIGDKMNYPPEDTWRVLKDWLIHFCPETYRREAG